MVLKAFYILFYVHYHPIDSSGYDENSIALFIYVLHY